MSSLYALDVIESMNYRDVGALSLFENKENMLNLYHIIILLGRADDLLCFKNQRSNVELKLRFPDNKFFAWGFGLSKNQQFQTMNDLYKFEN